MDDTLAGFHNSVEGEYRRIKAEDAKAINIGDLSINPVGKFVGAQITRDRQAQTITIRQEMYIEELARDGIKVRYRSVRHHMDRLSRRGKPSIT